MDPGINPGLDPGAGALVFGSFQALEAAKTQDCCSKMHVRKCCFSCPPLIIAPQEE